MSPAIVRSGTVAALEDEVLTDREAAVRVLRAGVCGTDLQILRGDRADAARVLGHEAVGLDQRERLVIFNPVDAADQDWILGHSYDGVFRSRFPLRERPPQLVPVPRTLPLELAAICEPVAAVLYGWELVGAHRRPEHIGIWGAGPIGVLHTFVALRRGLLVCLTHGRPERLAWVHERAPADGELVVRTSGGPLPRLEVAVMCTDRVGFEAALAEAVEALVPDGLLLLVGGVPDAFCSPLIPGADLSAPRRANTSGRHAPGGPQIVRSQTGSQLAVIGHRGTSAAQIRQAHNIMAADADLFSAVVTHVVDPGQAVALINARAAGAEQDADGHEIVKVVIRYGEMS
jgi:2-epi-valiolone-7-phosphate 1-reductase